MAEQEHEIAVQKERERLRAIPFKNHGEFDYREVEEGDCSLIRPCFAALDDRSEEENPRIFCSQCNLLKNVPGSRRGRIWIAMKGNMSCCIAFPLKYFPSNVVKEFLPVFCCVAIRDTFNKYAPGEFASKFPNDIVCRKHWKKCCGMLAKYYKKYAICTFGVDLIDCPPDEYTRAHGLKACCLQKHTPNPIPSFEEFLCTITQNIMDLMKKYDTIYKIIDFVNSSFCEYKRKTFSCELNNPNADPSVDGTTVCKDFPNAIIKAFINGKPYEWDETLYDPIETPPDDNEYTKQLDLMLDHELQLDIQIQEELEKKEEEEKKKKAEEEKKSEQK